MKKIKNQFVGTFFLVVNEVIYDEETVAPVVPDHDLEPTTKPDATKSSNSFGSSLLFFVHDRVLI